MNPPISLVLSAICLLGLAGDITTGLPSRHFRDNNDGSVTTRVIDLNNPEHERLLRQFNISADQLKQLRSPTTASSDGGAVQREDRLAEIKEMRVDIDLGARLLRYQDVKSKIENAINGYNVDYDNVPIHEMAAYPTCAQINETTWQQENNLTIRFAASLFENTHPDMYLDTAVLRLFKLNPQPESATTPRSPSCDDAPVESQIRVTVSTIQHLKRNKREKKKRICNTIMLNMSQTGWIEIDVKKAINLWEKAERQSRNVNYNSNNNNNNRLLMMVGWLTIEVHDEEEKPLKAGLYFEPPKCSEAFPAIPWNFYGQYDAWPANDMENVPRSPRLDIKLIDFRSVVPHRHNSNHNTHHSHRPAYHHTNTSPNTPDQPSTTEKLLEYTEYTRSHRRRHEQGHHNRHHHHQSERRQETTSSDLSVEE